VTEYSSTVVLDGLKFPEGPRWHDGRLWFSDMHAHRVMSLSPNGQTSVVAEVPNQPSGLGFLPDGRLLIVSMVDRKLLIFEPGKGLREIADVSNLATWHINDMVVDAEGRAYVGNFGFDLTAGVDQYKPANLVLVEPSGVARVVAEDMAFPNGAVITPDGGTLIVGETFGRKLTAFDIEPDGSLANRRLWADTKPANPDGICLDAEGGIWVASPTTREFVRITEGGTVTDRVSCAEGRSAYACMLGGIERKTLYLCTASGDENDRVGGRSEGWIESVEVAVAGAGLP
jgi:sugar lactone lactonase YvrE